MERSNVLSISKKIMLVAMLVIGSLSIAAPAAQAQASSSNEKVTNCWRAAVKQKENIGPSFYEKTIGTAYIVGRWCSTNGNASGPRVVHGHAETGTPGYEAIIGKKFADVIDNEAVMFQRFVIALGITTDWVNGPHNNEICPKIIGNLGTYKAQGRYYAGDDECSLYTIN